MSVPLAADYPFYLIVSHRGMAERSAKDIQQAQAAFDERVREAASTGGPAAEIEQARSLLQSGTINEAGFERLKAKALDA